jgi:hypothetical protein
MSEPKTIEDFTVAEIAALGDVVIVLRDSGHAGVAYIRGHKAPTNWSVDFGGKDDPPLTIRHATVKAGWLAKAWRDSNQEARREISEGTPEWQELHRD